jgi:hypothetical protein
MDTLLPRYPTAEVIEQMALADVYQALRQF